MVKLGNSVNAAYMELGGSERLFIQRGSVARADRAGLKILSGLLLRAHTFIPPARRTFRRAGNHPHQPSEQSQRPAAEGRRHRDRRGNNSFRHRNRTVTCGAAAALLLPPGWPHDARAPLPAWSRCCRSRYTPTASVT